jgi:DNA-directed RNA polymerase subunit RPC12/RpoP
MIRCRCPSCGTVLEASAEQGGSKVACPTCGQRLLVPPPSRERTALAPRVEGGGTEPPAIPSLEPFRAPPTVASAPPRAELKADDRDEPPPRKPGRYDDRPDDDRRRREWDDDDDDRPRRRRRGYDYAPCPRCGCTDRPHQTKKLGPAGIALLIAGIIFWPLLIVCIFMQETWETCPACGERIRQIGSGI